MGRNTHPAGPIMSPQLLVLLNCAALVRGGGWMLTDKGCIRGEPVQSWGNKEFGEFNRKYWKAGKNAELQSEYGFVFYAPYFFLLSWVQKESGEEKKRDRSHKTQR